MTDRRGPDRRGANRRDPAADGRALVPAAPPAAADDPQPPASDPPSHPAPPLPDPAYAAQVIAQAAAAPRGLRSGPGALDQARASYLGAEHSGARDRRPRPGREGETEA